MVRMCSETDVSMRTAVMTGGNVRIGKHMTAYPVSNGKRGPWAIKDSDGRYIHGQPVGSLSAMPPGNPQEEQEIGREQVLDEIRALIKKWS